MSETDFLHNSDPLFPRDPQEVAGSAAGLGRVWTGAIAWGCHGALEGSGGS